MKSKSKVSCNSKWKVKWKYIYYEKIGVLVSFQRSNSRHTTTNRQRYYNSMSVDRRTNANGEKHRRRH